MTTGPTNTQGRVRRRIVATALLAVAATIAVSTGVRALTTTQKPHPTAALKLRAQTPRRTIAPGQAATYRLRIYRPGRHRAVPIRLGVATRLPAGVTARFRSRVTRSYRATLTLRAGRTTRPGTYRLRLTARNLVRRGQRHGRRHAQTRVTLVVARPPARAVTISGATTTALAPGSSAPLDLRLANPHRTPLTIWLLTVSIAHVDAPQADGAHPCTAADFMVVPYAGPYGVRLGASSASTLSALGIPADKWPRIAMLDRPVNQDGCKHASLTLDFSARASGPGPRPRGR